VGVRLPQTFQVRRLKKYTQHTIGTNILPKHNDKEEHRKDLETNQDWQYEKDPNYLEKEGIEKRNREESHRRSSWQSKNPIVENLKLILQSKPQDLAITKSSLTNLLGQVSPFIQNTGQQKAFKVLIKLIKNFGQLKQFLNQCILKCADQQALAQVDPLTAISLNNTSLKIQFPISVTTTTPGRM